ncbi:unnamed protein product [Sphenostylis stenocarpa]|uniref:Uncharacterized protein n=1 Tax=Sphenostylis stenocarpa TaxID=92480 RepID=A0AA86SGL5_9FABA|nr:unnamed protein product [Sphenostylis stenocarpa]
MKWINFESLFRDADGSAHNSVVLFRRGSCAGYSMSSVTNSTHVLKNDGVPGQGSDILGRHKFETQLSQRNFKSSDAHNHIQDQDATPATELFSRARGQQEEILSLREQIAFACMKELQLLNEKCKLERQFSELRMAVDEKQSEAISSASNDLARRKGYLEENLKLAHDLKGTLYHLSLSTGEEPKYGSM